MNYLDDNDTDSDGAPSTKKICMISEYTWRTPLQGTAADNVYTDRGIQSTLTNVGLCYDAAVDANGYTTSNYEGMSFVYRLSDGSFMIIDGGFPNEGNADRLFNVLKKQANGGDIVIAAWIFTHDHEDHVGLFKTFSDKYHDQITIEKFLFNFPSSEQSTEGKASTYVTPIIAKYYKSAEVHKPHTGYVYYIRNATVTILFALDAYEPLALSGTMENTTLSCNYNCSSMIFQVAVNGVSTMFLGDCQDAEREALKDTYSENVFKSDIVQVAHHGIWGCGKGVYEDIGATYTVVPLGADKMKTANTAWDSVLLSGDKMSNFNDYFVSNGSLKNNVYLSENNVVIFTLNNGSVSVNQFDSVESYLNG